MRKRSVKLARPLRLAMTVAAALAAAGAASAAASIYEAIDKSQPAIVKIYGAGGLRGLEPYQSGMLISAEGHVLTVLSHVLDSDAVTATLADGRRFEARLLGADPRLEVAVLKIDAEGLPHFDLGQAVELAAGAGVLALSNLFGVAAGNEPASVQQAVVSATTRLHARRGVFQTAYDGPVYVLDAVTNNPGAAGGAVVTRGGELAGMLGKELRNAQNHTWLNYAVPIGQLRESAAAIQAGKFAVASAAEPDAKPARGWGLAAMGVVLVPDVVEWTPPYVDSVRPGSPAARGGLRPDDLAVLVGNQLIRSCKSLVEAIAQVDRDDRLSITVQRGQELVEFSLESSEEGESPQP